MGVLPAKKIVKNRGSSNTPALFDLVVIKGAEAMLYIG